MIRFRMAAGVLKLAEGDPRALVAFAAKELKSGRVIAVPTDTIYGIAGLVQDPQAVETLHSIKGRHPDKPMSICLAEVDDVFLWADVTVAVSLLKRLLPGPVTVCFERSRLLNPSFNPGARLVGIRIPDHPFVRDVCRAVGGGTPIALTSANVSSSESCLEVSEFVDRLTPRGLGTVFDGGRVPSFGGGNRAGSTIIDLSGVGLYRVIRDGSALAQTVELLECNGLRKLI